MILCRYSCRIGDLLCGVVLGTSCVVWECLFGFAYFWWCSIQYFVMRNCLHVVCDDLRVYMCCVCFYIFLRCSVWWCVSRDRVSMLVVNMLLLWKIVCFFSLAGGSCVVS